MKEFTKVVQENLDITQSKTLKDSLHEALKKTIVLGDIPAGTRINEKELSESLNISRTPIRHALEKLEEEQLVERIYGSGVIVTGITKKDAIEIFDIRKSLDTLASIKAAQKMSKEDFDDLEALLLEANELYENKKNKKLTENFKSFNQFIYEKCDMKRLTSIITNLKEYTDYFRVISIYSEERSGPALKGHWDIFEAMRRKDWKLLEETVHNHLEDSVKFILKEMEEREIG